MFVVYIRQQNSSSNCNILTRVNKLTHQFRNATTRWSSKTMRFNHKLKLSSCDEDSISCSIGFDWLSKYKSTPYPSRRWQFSGNTLACQSSGGRFESHPRHIFISAVRSLSGFTQKILVYTSFEYSSINLKLNNSKLFMFNLYRPPPPSPYSQPFSVYIDQLSSLLTHVSTTPNEFIITGVFNIHVDDSLDSQNITFPATILLNTSPCQPTLMVIP